MYISHVKVRSGHLIFWGSREVEYVCVEDPQPCNIVTLVCLIVVVYAWNVVVVVFCIYYYRKAAVGVAQQYQKRTCFLFICACGNI